MTPALLLPAGLAALAALLLPLLIHIARRSQQRPTDFAALRWLRHKPRPRHRLRLDEWPLLLLRLLLLALLAVWLARPVLHGSASVAPWVAVAPGVDATRALALAEARRQDDAPQVRVHWLAPGFTALDEGQAGPDPIGPLAFSSLLRQLDAELPAGAPLTVLVPEVLQGVDAQRPRLSREIHWQVVPGQMPAPEAPPAAEPPVLHVRHAPALEPAVRYLRAAATAWQAVPPGLEAPPPLPFHPAAADAPLPAGASVLAWLSPEPLPAPLLAWVDQGGTALLDASTPFDRTPATIALWRDEEGDALVEGHARGAGRLLRFTRALQPDGMPGLLQPDFPRGLRSVLEPAPPPPARVAASDHAPMAGAAGYTQPPRDLRPWLALLIALVLLLERWMATRRTRGVAP